MQGKIQISTWVSGLSRSGYKAALHLYIVNDINDIIANSNLGSHKLN